jgi:hypothetical protein
MLMGKYPQFRLCGQRGSAAISNESRTISMMMFMEFDCSFGWTNPVKNQVRNAEWNGWIPQGSWEIPAVRREARWKYTYFG